MKKEKTSQWGTSKDHLNKTFLEELGHKIWSTKGVRFGASQKLLSINTWSSLSLGFLSAYLIIYGLFSVYQISGIIILDSKIIAFSSTTISILLLVFTQYESAQDYKVRALEFHRCAIEMSALYDEIRLFKTIGNKSEKERRVFCRELSAKYQEVVKSYENHGDIDYKIFIARNQEYYGVSDIKLILIYIRYYLKTFFVYHLLIVGPILVFIISFLFGL